MLERAKKVTNEDGYLHIEYARWADDCIILIDGHQKWDWLEKAAYKRLKDELCKLKVELNIRPPDPDEFKLPLIYKLTANLSLEKSYLFHSSPHKDAAKLCPKHDLRGDVI